MKAESIIKLSLPLDVSCNYIVVGKSNSIDFNYLSDLVHRLDEKQIKHLEVIIKNFVSACTDSN